MKKQFIFGCLILVILISSLILLPVSVSAASFPDPPPNFNVLILGSSSVVLDWDPPDYAFAYTYRWSSVSSSGPWNDENTFIWHPTSHKTVSGLSSGTTYYFQMCGWRDDKDHYTRSDWTSVIAATPQSLTPTGLSVQSAGYNSLTLSWNGSPTVQGYQIERSTGSTWTRLESLYTGTAFTDTGLVCGTTYSYRIRTYTNYDGNINVSAWCASQSGTTIPDQPERALAFSFDYDTLRLDWRPVDGAHGYRIERASSFTGPWAFVDNSTTDSYMDSGLACGATYFYRVRAYHIVTRTIVINGNWSSVFSGATEPRRPWDLDVESTGYDSLALEWSPVNGAGGYAIQRATASGGPWTVIVTSTASTSYADTGLTCGKEYFYQVRAYRTVSKVRIYGEWSGTTSGTPIPASPAYFHLGLAGSQKIRVEWSSVNGANGYAVERATSSSGPWSVIHGSVKGLEYLDSGLVNGKPYYYRVRGYRIISKIPEYVYGEYTPILSLTPYASPTPTPSPSPFPWVTPTVTPGITPSISPGITPSVSPGITPSVSPGISPSVSPEPSLSVSPGAQTDPTSTGSDPTAALTDGSNPGQTGLTEQDPPLSSSGETGDPSSSDPAGVTAAETTGEGDSSGTSFPWSIVIPIVVVLLGGGLTGVLLVRKRSA